MFYTIYKTTCLLNSKFYIGKHKTKNLEDGYIGSGKLLRRAIKKYGKENFVTEILEVYDTEAKMNLAEKILVVIDKHLSYNLCPGGQGGWGFINNGPNKKEIASKAASLSNSKPKNPLKRSASNRAFNQERRKKERNLVINQHWFNEVDFSKRGWGIELNNNLNLCSATSAARWLKIRFPEIYESAWPRNLRV